MATIKAAVSIEESLFREVDDLARSMKVPRSQLVSEALEEMLRRHRSRDALRKLNEAYAEPPDAGEKAHRKHARATHRKLVEGEW